MFRHDDQPGDHIHQIGISYGENGRGNIELITSFDFDEIDHRLGLVESEEDQVSFGDMAAAFSLILQCMIGQNRKKPRSLVMVGALAMTLQCFLDPVNCRFKSLAQIAEEAGCTRAALSSWLLDLRDQIDMTWQMNKPQGTREAYRVAQLEALERGTHASQKRRENAETIT